MRNLFMGLFTLVMAVMTVLSVLMTVETVVKYGISGIGFVPVVLITGALTREAWQELREQRPRACVNSDG